MRVFDIPSSPSLFSPPLAGGVGGLSLGTIWRLLQSPISKKSEEVVEEEEEERFLVSFLGGREISPGRYALDMGSLSFRCRGCWEIQDCLLSRDIGQGLPWS